LTTDPIGVGSVGEPVFLKDIWPTNDEVRQTLAKSVLPQMFSSRYSNVFEANETWNKIKVAEGDLYQWDAKSTYIQEPPFLADMTFTVGRTPPLWGARCPGVLGNSVPPPPTPPVGNTSKPTPAGKFLVDHGVQPADFNSYGSRRGNDRVMVRGTF